MCDIMGQEKKQRKHLGEKACKSMKKQKIF